MRNKVYYETGHAPEHLRGQELLRAISRTLREALPGSWTVELLPEREAQGYRSDGVFLLRSPDGTEVHVLAEEKRRLDPKDVPLVTKRLSTLTTAPGTPRMAGMIVSSYLGARTRDLIAAAGVGYADATANLRLQIECPVIFIQRDGAVTNPWKDNQPLRSLKGPTAGRVVRALCDFRPPYGIRELAERSKTSAPVVSRVAALLEREALVTRDKRGGVMDVHWLPLIQRWTEDYHLTTSNQTRSYLEPRGFDALLRKLSAASLTYSVTGSLAAARVSPLAPPRLALVYVSDIGLAAQALDLRAAERGANVVLLKPFNPVVFERTIAVGGTIYAAFSQVAADLLTSPGRGPEEGQELLHWMRDNEDAWR